jgi:hypothetical protein
MDADEDGVVGKRWRGDILDAENLGASVLMIGRCPHAVSLPLRCPAL